MSFKETVRSLFGRKAATTAPTVPVADAAGPGFKQMAKGWAEEQWAKDYAKTPNAKWEKLRESFPLTVDALQTINDIRPEMRNAVVDSLEGQSRRTVWTFLLGLPGFLFPEECKYIPREIRFFPPLRIRYYPEDNRIGYAGHCGSYSLSDAEAAEAILTAAKTNEFITIAEEKGVGGLTRTRLVAGPAQSWQQQLDAKKAARVAPGEALNA